MQFFYDQIKAVQAATYLVNKRGGKHDFGSLVKLLYLADRETLLTSGGSITGGYPTCLPYGMVLSEVLDNANWTTDNPYWRQFLSKPEEESNQVHLITTPPIPDHLSEFERDILDAIDQKYGNWSFHQLRQFTHDLPEYQDPNGSSIRIDPEIIMQKAGIKKEYIQEITAQVAARRLLHTLLQK